MYTIHYSRDMGCPVRGFVDDRDPAAAHRSAAALLRKELEEIKARNGLSTERKTEAA